VGNSLLGGCILCEQHLFVGRLEGRLQVSRFFCSHNFMIALTINDALRTRRRQMRPTLTRLPWSAVMRRGDHWGSGASQNSRLRNIMDPSSANFKTGRLGLQMSTFWCCRSNELVLHQRPIRIVTRHHTAIDAKPLPPPTITHQIGKPPTASALDGVAYFDEPARLSSSRTTLRSMVSIGRFRSCIALRRASFMRVW